MYTKTVKPEVHGRCYVTYHNPFNSLALHLYTFGLDYSLVLCDNRNFRIVAEYKLQEIKKACKLN